MKVDNQACSNVLAYYWRPLILIGRAGAGETPVRDESPSSPPCSRSVLHPDHIGGWSFCWVTVALRLDTKDEDTTHHLVVTAGKLKVRMKNATILANFKCMDLDKF